MEKIYGTHNIDYATSLSRLAENEFENGSLQQSLEYYHKAIDSFLEDFNNTSVFSNPTIEMLDPSIFCFWLITRKASVLRFLYEDTQDKQMLLSSFETYKLSIAFLDKIRLSNFSDWVKQDLIKKTHLTFNSAISLSFELYKQDSLEQYAFLGFEFSEKSKAFQLLQSIGSRKFTDIPDSLLHAEKLLKLDITNIENSLTYETNIITIADLKVQLKQSKGKLHEIIKLYESRYPQYYSLKYNPDVFSINKLQSFLNDDEAIYHVTLKKDDIFIFTVTNTDYFLTSLPFDSTIKSDITYLLQVQKKPAAYNNIGDNSTKKFQDVASRLHNNLFPESIKKMLTDKKHIIIIPDGMLNYLSFEILVGKKIQKENITYKDLDYLIKRHEISYSYSATTYFNSTKAQVDMQQKGYLGFAPTYKMDLFTDNEQLAAFNQFRSEPYNLPGANEEVKISTDLFDGDSYYGLNATESNFKNIVSKYSIIHLAMHALVDDTDPMHSKLLFTEIKDTLNDGYLNTFEIYSLDLNADLAVLSACNTGNGMFVEGEGIVSLAHAFIYAGCKSIVMSRWYAEDNATKKIVTSFFNFIKAGHNKSTALRQAKLDYINSSDPLTGHPFFWSNMSLIGNNDALLINKNKSKSRWLYFTLLLALLIVVVWVVKHNKP
jgi:CHAT domain-containing protein